MRMRSLKTKLDGSLSYSAAIKRGGDYKQVYRCCILFHAHNKQGHFEKQNVLKVSYATIMACCTHTQLVTHSSLAMVQYISLSQSVTQRFAVLFLLLYKRNH